MQNCRSISYSLVDTEKDNNYISSEAQPRRKCLCVCLSLAGRRIPTVLHGPRCNLEEWYGVPSSCALLGGFAISAWVSYSTMTTHIQLHVKLMITTMINEYTQAYACIVEETKPRMSTAQQSRCSLDGRARRPVACINAKRNSIRSAAEARHRRDAESRNEFLGSELDVPSVRFLLQSVSAAALTPLVVHQLCSPYVIGQTIMFLPCDFYLSSFFLSFFLSCFLSFPRLISAAVDWMSTIVPHIVWPQCEFRMHV